MKNQLLLVMVGVVLGGLAPSSWAQAPAGLKKGPTGKIYLAEVKGETQIFQGGKIYTPRQAMTFDAPGTIIETKANSHDAFVYSNGTGMFVDQNTRVEIGHFAQEPFQPPDKQSAETITEPSISQSVVLVARGAVGVCTSHLLSGSTMTYSTPQALVNIRRGRVSIQTTVEMTIVDLLEGDITVRIGDKDPGGQILRAGERATIRSGRTDQPAAISVGLIPPDSLLRLDERVTIACNAKRTVTFKAIGKDVAQEQATQATDPAANPDAAGAGQEIIASPTVPQSLPTNITVSPDRLPGG